MISMIDQGAVCGHFKAMLSGVVKDDDIQKAVGRLHSLSPDNYEQVAKELAIVFTNAFLGRFDIPPEDIPHLGLLKRQAEFVTRHGQVVSGNVYRETWINELLHLPPGPATHRKWASMTNLKSACVIFDLSRREKKAQCEAIRRIVTIDPEVLSEWKEFVDIFTPKLLHWLGLKRKPDKKVPKDLQRKHDPIWMVPSGGDVSSRTLSPSGRLIKCRRGDSQAVDPTYQLKHPVIQEIASKYPKRFAEACFYGYEVEGEVEIQLPPPFAGELPIGASALAPKRAEKPRTVWIVLSLLDSASRPAFHLLEQIEARWNIQGVMDHNGAREHIRYRLMRNVANGSPNVFCSYDQTAFTDNFSYKYIQRVVAEALVENNYLEPYDLFVIDKLNYGSWDLTSLGIKHELVRFGTGTGMGTPPSFPLASITNGYMVAFANWKALGKPPKGMPNGTRFLDPPGLVVGDDCTIFDGKTGDEYEKFCRQIGLKINETKSFRAADVAEFCGKIITPDGIFDKRKLKDFPDINSFIEVAKYYQEDAKAYFSAFEDKLGLRVYSTLEAVQKTPAPFGAKDVQPNHTDFDLSDIVEKMVTATLEVADLDSLLAPEPGASSRDIQLIAKRKLRNPRMTCTDITPVFPDVHDDEPRVDLLKDALVRNILLAWRRALDTKDWELIIQSSRKVNELYLALIDNDPNVFKTFKQRELPRVAPPPKKEVATDYIQKGILDLQLRMNSDKAKGGPYYDF